MSNEGSADGNCDSYWGRTPVGGKMLISAKVKPGSSRGDIIEKLEDGTYIIYLRARAHDGEANTALIKLLSKTFNVPKTSIKIKSGLSSRTKIIEL